MLILNKIKRGVLLFLFLSENPDFSKNANIDSNVVLQSMIFTHLCKFAQTICNPQLKVILLFFLIYVKQNHILLRIIQQKSINICLFYFLGTNSPIIQLIRLVKDQHLILHLLAGKQILPALQHTRCGCTLWATSRIKPIPILKPKVQRKCQSTTALLYCYCLLFFQSREIIPGAILY
ncbi:hypothetical protein FGO68_gene11023 [Halteria grandinella]|uniref:Uncharacterized protein n=1 Tax=Halteria grandinella TaxID=5974 RepID=A0A8J8NBM4_HALGN|nr:hypothetical protein FGO68_gene11023 [Halteria grandinella]